jgi:hypothetical protein
VYPEREEEKKKDAHNTNKEHPTKYPKPYIEKLKP